MGIVDDDIARVRDQTDIVQIISSYTQLKRVGRRFTGLCPFHTEKSPSFSVNAEQGLYYCFGCQAKGDSITFVREQEQLDFVGAVEFLAGKAGITLNYTDKHEGEDRKRRARLHELLDQAVDWYHDRLMNSPDAGAARSYLRQRGYDAEIVKAYRIGWAPDEWDQLSRALKKSNPKLSDNDWIDAGLGKLNRRGGRYDFFRGRVLFPIFDAQDRAMGFGGRILPGSDDPAKYRNSADSGVYQKSRILYGLNWAKTAVVEADEVIVCEGYTDVIGFSQAKVPRAVATCGTALTEDHVKLLSRFANRVVLAFDADAAGQNAAARFYEWEKKHSLDVAVADLPDGVDPGDLARSDPAELERAVTEAKPFLAFRVERALSAGDLSTAEGRAKTAESALAMVAEHPDALVRDQYAMDIASHCRLEPDLVRRILEQGPKAGAQNRGRKERAVVRPRRRREGPELEAMKLAVQRGDEMNALITTELFADDTYATIHHLLGQYDSIHELVAQAEPDLADIVQQLAVEESPNEPDDVAAQLWGSYLQRRIDDCVRRMRTSASSDDLREVNADLRWYREQLELVRDPERRVPAVHSLLSWLQPASEGDS